MAIYQAPRKRWRTAVATGVVGAVIGFGIGFVVHHGSTDTVTTLRKLDQRLDEAAAPLDVLVIHGDVNTSSAKDPRVARDALRRARAAFDGLRPDVHVLDPSAERRVNDGLDRLQQLIDGHASTAKIAAQARVVASAMRAILSG
jgi:uncharacterized NAD-dependent epimerase/dehydratase family protein